MANWREKLRMLLPNRVSFELDSIHLPWYNLDVYGGVNMSKDKMIAVAKKENETYIGSVAEAASNICAEICSNIRNADDNFVKIICNTDISDEQYEQALNEYNKRQRQRQRNVYITVGAATLVICSIVICNCVAKCSAK